MVRGCSVGPRGGKGRYTFKHGESPGCELLVARESSELAMSTEVPKGGRLVRSPPSGAPSLSDSPTLQPWD